MRIVGNENFIAVILSVLTENKFTDFLGSFDNLSEIDNDTYICINIFLSRQSKNKAT